MVNTSVARHVFRLSGLCKRGRGENHLSGHTGTRKKSSKPRRSIEIRIRGLLMIRLAAVRVRSFAISRKILTFDPEPNDSVSRRSSIAYGRQGYSHYTPDHGPLPTIRAGERACARIIASSV